MDGLSAMIMSNLINFKPPGFYLDFWNLVRETKYTFIDISSKCCVWELWALKYGNKDKL